MRKLLFTLSLLMITSVSFTQEKSLEDRFNRMLARSKKNNNCSFSYESIVARVNKLIEEKKFGPELADLLDSKFALEDRTYQGEGVYAIGKEVDKAEDERTCMYDHYRHLCEGITEEELATSPRTKESDKVAQTKNLISKCSDAHVSAL